MKTKFTYFLFAMFIAFGLNAQTFSSAKITKPVLPPLQKADVDVHYDGDPYTAVGTNSAATFTVAVRFTADELSSYYGNKMISKVKFAVLTENNEGTETWATSAKILIYGNGTATKPGTLLVEEPAGTLAYGWNEFILPTPLLIESGDYWVGYEVTTDAGFPAACDAGPMVPGKGGWISFDGIDWDELASIPLDYNWNIRATLSDAIAPEITISPENNATNVPLSSEITISFSKPVRNLDDTEITDVNVASLITLKVDSITGADVPFTATINTGKDTITITPSSLLESKKYYIELASVEDTLNIATEVFTSSFTTVDLTAPVATIYPADGTADVAVDTFITIAFNEPVFDKNGADITDANLTSLVTLRIDSITGANVPFTATINAEKDIIIITPTPRLLNSKTYFVLLDSVQDASGNAADSLKSTFTTIADYIAPVATIYPADGAVNVPIDVIITINFDEPVRKLDDSDITDADLPSLVALKIDSITGADVPFTATINAEKDLITITPTPELLHSKIYFIKLDSLEDALNNAADTLVSKFTTADPDTVAPVATIYPADGAVDVLVDVVITIGFNEPVRNLDNSEITDADLLSLVTLKVDSITGADVPFTATINTEKDLITITPSSDLLYSKTYFVKLDSVEDASNNATDVLTSSFTTIALDTVAPVATIYPADGAVDVPVGVVITIGFNEPVRNLNNSEITDADLTSLVTFKLNDNAGADVPFSATINTEKDLITITPSSELLNNQIYYLELDSVEDAADNATDVLTSSFTTVAPSDVTPPVATSASLTSLSIANVTFDEAVDPTTAEDAANYTGLGDIASVEMDGTDKVILTLVNPLVNAQTYTLTVGGISDLAGNVMTTTYQFDLKLDTTIGINNHAIGLIEMYPNPANNYFIIDNIENASMINVYNSIGKAVINKDCRELNRVEIDATILESGLYYVSIYYNDGQVVSKPISIVK